MSIFHHRQAIQNLKQPRAEEDLSDLGAIYSVVFMILSTKKP
jgi:hypothetical protein